MIDLLLCGGLLIDGSGNPPKEASIGISGDQIVYVGSDNSEIETIKEMDISGSVISPGFIDIHTHSDFSLLVNRKAESSIRQGVTTEIVGNCGMGCAPIRDIKHLPLLAIDYLPELDITWNTFGEWLDTLQAGGLSINVAALIGHGPIRMAAMGSDCRQANRSEVQEMVRLVKESMNAGAFGFSTGLEYTPGKCASTDEIIELATAVGDVGGFYATHIRDRDYHFIRAIEEAISIAATSGVSIQISHVSPRWGAPRGANTIAFEKINRAIQEGLDIWFDNHPYTFGRGLVLSTLPNTVLQGGTELLKKHLENADRRNAMADYDNPQWKHRLNNRWDLLTISDAPHNRKYEGQTVEAIASSTNQEPWDVVCNLLLDEVNNPMALYWSAPIHKQADIDASFQHERGIIMSDSSTIAPYGPYSEVRNIYAYGWASYVLRNYVRERGVLSMEEAIHKMSGLPAERLGLKDRGVILPGYKADIVIFEPDKVRDRATRDQPIAFPTGIQYVFVNGVLTVSNGNHTGALAGRVLRRND